MSIMILVHFLIIICIKGHFRIKLQHITEVDNRVAMTFSSFQREQFRTLSLLDDPFCLPPEGLHINKLLPRCPQSTNGIQLINILQKLTFC